MLPTITPNWPVLNHIYAYTTTRQGGISTAPYDSLNLGDHVGDISESVKQNREILYQALSLPNEPIWLTQIHSNKVIDGANHTDRQGDGCFSHHPNVVCAILTADCLPILICNRQGDKIAAIHGGWRGLASGIIKNAIEKLATPAEELLVWLGPAIGAHAFEVGNEVREVFINQDKENHIAFTYIDNTHWLADIYQLAQLQLRKLGIQAIYGGEYCTVRDSDLFYSYRRDGLKTGRMATLIWYT
ncbi:peptidoglycan editing factor PgeF [Candidatus Nitrosacidococcus tergens]|uniref:Purine nucleoside phosphorylase n=1 Tax=Candidatus Nitrosacidococcus tergens TaxID=553981 RepID=A0A7G1QBR6_9GAMM|nr:peptidoglycan editing factor PgeF [Candidatus Nitrosacidococcus tergens]CAB1276837.1 Laccase domain protein YfiH [Candidatus Nitrosacidococcus tergens]